MLPSFFSSNRTLHHLNRKSALHAEILKGPVRLLRDTVAECAEHPRQKTPAPTRSHSSRERPKPPAGIPLLFQIRQLEVRPHAPQRDRTHCSDFEAAPTPPSRRRLRRRSSPRQAEGSST